MDCLQADSHLSTGLVAGRFLGKLRRICRPLVARLNVLPAGLVRRSRLTTLTVYRAGTVFPVLANIS